MGYRGKVVLQQEARRLRADAWTLAEIAAELGVSKSSASLWVRDVAFVPRERRQARRRGPNRLERRKAEEISRLRVDGRKRIGRMSDGEFLVAGAALYAGEGSKRDGCVNFANTDPRMMAFFCAWLRRFFDVDEARLRVRIYLHQGLDLDAAQRHWSTVTSIPLGQFRTPHRAVADPTIRVNKHEYGCAYVRYGCSRTHRAIMGLVDALLSSEAIPGW